MGILALGPDRRGLCSLVFFFEARLVFEKPPRAREGSLKKNRENTCNLPKNVILKNPFKREHRSDASLSLCRMTDVTDVSRTRGVLNAVFSAVVHYIQVIWLLYTGKRYFLVLVLNFGYSVDFWSVRDYVPFRHQIFFPVVYPI